MQYIETTGHRDIVKTSSAIIEDKKQNEILRYRAKFYPLFSEPCHDVQLTFVFAHL